MPKATDGNPGTFWETEHYRDHPSLNKPGVGLILDAGSSVQLHQLGIATGTPGFTAQIKASDSPTAFSTVVAGSQAVTGQTRFQITGSGAYRYYLIWITKLGGGYPNAEINEVDAGVPVVSVRAHRGKYLRAEPVATLYEQGCVRHAGSFPALEDEMCDFGPGGLTSGRSPDRLDALVWAIASLTFTSRAQPRVRGL